MSIRTALTETFGLTHPLVLAPMGGVSGGELAAAVSNAGGLGLVGGGYGDPQWLARELEIVAAKSRGKWGVGLITWHASAEALELALSFRPHAFFLSFGDARPFIPAIKRVGCVLIMQVQDVAAARDAQAQGADFIVAQGTEAGGHGASRATMPLVPAVVDAVHPTPVLAAGGIGDGRGLAAVLALGAAGAVLGTCFCVTNEALTHPQAKQRIVASDGAQTVRTHVFDTARGYTWPSPYSGRALQNSFLARWHDRDEALAANADELARYRAAAQSGDFDTALVYAGEVMDLIHRIEPAAGIVERVGGGAERWLRSARDLLGS
jgi:nitronate monooxygenase